MLRKTKALKTKTREINFISVNLYELLGFDFDYNTLDVGTLQNELTKFIKSKYVVIPQKLKIELIY